MLQLIINKTEDREIMIVSSDKKKIVFVKDKNNIKTDNGKLYTDIIELLNDYLA